MKAKDLLNKNTDDSELDEVHELPDPEEVAPKKISHEDDKVTAAYEEINRKLSALRAGKPIEDEDGESRPKDDQPLAEDEDDDEDEEDDKEAEDEDDDPKPRKMEDDEELDPLDSEVPIVDKESDDEEEDEQDPVDKLEEEDLKADEVEEDEVPHPKDDQSLAEENQKVRESDQSDEDLAPRKTFEPASNPEAPHQFRTSNIRMDEDTPPKRDDGPFDSLDDLAQSEDQQPQNRQMPNRMSQNDDQPMGNPQYSEMNNNAPKAEVDDGLDIPPLNAPRQQYNFSQATNHPTQQPFNQGNSESGPRGYTSRRNNNSFGGEFQHRSSKGKGSAIFQLLILLLIGAGVIGGTVYFLKNQFGTTNTTPSPSPSANSQIAIPEATPTPTPIPVDRSKFKIRVLNGTSKTGLASTVADKLKGLGYGIDRTGNATNSAFEKTIVRVKENQASLSGQLIQDLAPDYTPDVQVTLKATDPIDSEIILGEK